MSIASLDALSRALGQRTRLHFAQEGYRESAVLVPIVVEEGAPDRLLFIERPGGMRTHAGQVAFPGGKRDDDDDGAASTALREAEEELGLSRTAVSVLGLLDDIPTPSGYIITPVVARVQGPLDLRPARGEVEAAFFADLPSLRANYQLDGEAEFLGVRWPMHSYRWEHWNIWGATARIVHQLLALFA